MRGEPDEVGVRHHHACHNGGLQAGHPVGQDHRRALQSLEALRQEPKRGLPPLVGREPDEPVPTQASTAQKILRAPQGSSQPALS